MQISRRIAGGCGLAFVALSLVVGVTAPEPPSLAAPGSEIVSYFTAHQFGFQVGNYLGALAILPALVLLVHLVTIVRRADPEGPMWLLVVAANVTSFAVAMVLFAALQATAVIAPQVPPQTAKAVADIANMVFGFTFLTTAAAVGALAWAFLQAGLFGRYLPWAGFAVSALHMVASLGTLVVTGPLAAGGIVSIVALVVFLGWFLWLSVDLLVRPG